MSARFNKPRQSASPPLASGASSAQLRSRRSRSTEDLIGFGDYIDLQLAKVRTYIRLNDLAVSVVSASALIAALFFAAILVDHWIVDLGRLGRFAVLAIALVIGLYVLFKQVVPLAAKRLNPAYVAKVVESGNPSLKNSLLNLVLFRSQTTPVRKVVLDAVERQAATDLARVDVDATLDRTPIIRMGTALAALTFVFALYALVSPKDPLQSVARILAPWTDRARPSRVEILDVQPGTSSIYAGRPLVVTATIIDLKDNEEVAVRFTTQDGQAVDSRVEMHRAESDGEPSRANDVDGRWKAIVPRGEEGLHQDLTYKIVAGDAVAGPFRIQVIPAPSIVVREITYDYPAYMRREPVTVTNAGEINTVEGTRVTVRANANQPIEYAYVEFDADQATDRPRKTVALKHSDREAWGSFTATLNADRRTPRYSNYQVRFRNLDQATNDRPVQYGIQVTPDIAPVVEILTPQKRDVEVPVNGVQTIEVRALDPDYGLAKVQLHGSIRNQRPFDHDLIHAKPNDRPILGQRVVAFQFRPTDYGLEPGDVVDYQAIAYDNRVAPDTGKPDSNTTETEVYQIRITAPDPRMSDRDRNGRPTGQANNRQNSQNGDSQDSAGQNRTGQNPDEQKNQKNGRGDENREGARHEESAHNGQDQPKDDGERDGRRKERRDDGENESQQGREQGKETGSPEEGRPQERDGQKEEGPQKEDHDQNGQDQGTDAQQAGQPDEGATDQQQQGQNGQQAGDGEKNQGGSKGQSRQNGSQNEEPGTEDHSARRDAEGQSGQNGNQNADADSARRQEGRSGGEGNPGTDSERATERDSGNGDAPPSNPSGDTDPGQSDESRRNGSTDDQTPLPSDGSRDGDAMERILERIRKKTGRRPESGSNGERDPSRVECENCDDGSCEACQRNLRNRSNETTGAENRKRLGDSPRDQNDRNAATPNREARNAESQNAESQNAEAQNAEAQNADKSNREAENGAQEKSADSESKDASSSADRTEPNGARSETNDANGGDQVPDDQGSASQNAPASENAPTSQDASPNSSNPGKPGTQGPPSQDPGTQGSTSQTPDAGSAGMPQQGTSDPSQGDGADGAAKQDEMTDFEADEANLDYANEATDLVLDYLREQRNRRDPELLDELGWTPEQLAEFTRRWRQLKQDAERNDPVGVSARRELDDVLRSLGLSPTPDRTLRSGQTRDDIQSGNTGRRSRPPSKYRDRYDRFLKSARGSR